MATHDIGDLVRLWIVWYNESGVQTAPTTVSLTLRHPDGTVEDVPVEEASAGDLTLASASLGTTITSTTGVNKAVVEPDESGIWRYKWSGTGTVIEVQESQFEVRLDRVGEVGS